MQLKREFVLREIAGEALLVPAGKSALELNGLLSLNEVGAAVWSMLPEAQNAEELVQRILAEYDAQPEQVRADVSDFLGRLSQLGIL